MTYKIVHKGRIWHWSEGYLAGFHSVDGHEVDGVSVPKIVRIKMLAIVYNVAYVYDRMPVCDDDPGESITVEIDLWTVAEIMIADMGLTDKVYKRLEKLL